MAGVRWDTPEPYVGDDWKGLRAWIMRAFRSLREFLSFVPTYERSGRNLHVAGNIILEDGATVDGVDISELKPGGGEVPEGIVLQDGSTPFLAPQEGVAPALPKHLTTREWVEEFVWGVAFGGIPPQQPNPNGWVPPPVPAHPIKIGGIGVITDDLRGRFAQLPQGNITMHTASRSRVVWDEERHRFIFMVRASSGSNARLVTYDPTEDALSVVDAGETLNWGATSGYYDSLYLGYDGSSYIYSSAINSSGTVSQMRRHPMAGGTATDFNYTMGPEFAASRLRFDAGGVSSGSSNAMATQFFVHDPAYPTGFWALHTYADPPNNPAESHLAWVSTSSGQVASIVDFGAMGLRLHGAAGRVGRWLYFFATANSMGGTVEPYEHSGLFRIHLDNFTLEHVFGNGITTNPIFGQSSSTPAVLGHLVCATSDQVWIARGDTRHTWGGCSYIYRIDIPTGVSTPITTDYSTATWKIDSEITYPCSSPFTGDMSSAGTPAQYGFAPDVNNALTYSIGSLASTAWDLAVCYHWESDLL